MNYEDTSITKWFKIKNKDYVQSPKYFYYDGQNIEFLLERPKKYYKIGLIKWKEYDTSLSICCSKKVYKYALLNNNEYLNFKNIAENNYNHSQIPIIKSNLQKCIRRSLVNKSIRSALTILCLKPSELLRRLPIIMLEDVELNNNFLFLVWLMCAESKGFPLNDEYMKKILAIVYGLASCKSRDLVYKKDSINIRKQKINNLSVEERNILWSLQLRKSYGGMNGDMKMINYFSELWFNRFSNKYDLVKYEDIKLDKLRLLRKKDIISPSIDFHCTNIITFIKNKYNDLDEAYIKSAIWFHRSSFNNKNINEGKEEIDKEYIQTWNKISRYVDFSSKIIIKNNF